MHIIYIALHASAWAQGFHLYTNKKHLAGCDRGYSSSSGSITVLGWLSSLSQPHMASPSPSFSCNLSNSLNALPLLWISECLSLNVSTPTGGVCSVHHEREYCKERCVWVELTFLAQNQTFFKYPSTVFLCRGWYKLVTICMSWWIGLSKWFLPHHPLLPVSPGQQGTYLNVVNSFTVGHKL